MGSLGPLVQSVERRTVNPYVIGSSPIGAAFEWRSFDTFQQGRFGTSPCYMPRVAAGLSRWPFKPKYRVQLSDGVPYAWFG